MTNKKIKEFYQTLVKEDRMAKIIDFVERRRLKKKILTPYCAVCGREYNDFDHENYCVLNNKTYAELFEELDEVGLKEYVEHYTEFLNEIEEKKESIVKVLEALNEYSGGVNRSIYRILSFISSLERYRKREDTEMDWWEVGSFLIDNDIPHENNFNDICVLVLGQEIVLCQEDDELYIRSATAGDYSPSCPWNAPGMCISNFI